MSTNGARIPEQDAGPRNRDYDIPEAVRQRSTGDMAAGADAQGQQLQQWHHLVGSGTVAGSIGATTRENRMEDDGGADEYYYQTRELPLWGEGMAPSYGMIEGIFDGRITNRSSLRYNALDYSAGFTRCVHGAPTTAAASSSDASTSAPPRKKQRKRANYLRHSQRCAIIERIAGGEQQAALAREYNVTRAAVCHIQKNRLEILSHEVEDDESEQEQENAADPPRANPLVTEIRGNPVLLMLTKLRDLRTTPPVFRQSACRLMMALVEEAVALLGTRSVMRIGAGGHPYTGLERQHDFCGISLNVDAVPFAAIFQQVEENASVGSIVVEVPAEADPGHSGDWEIAHMDLPESIAVCKILLFSFYCGTGGEECKAIETLRALGIQEDDISLVAIQCSSAGLVAIGNQFPHVRVITAAVDDQVNPGATVIFPGLNAFAHYYRSYLVSAPVREDENKRRV